MRFLAPRPLFALALLILAPGASRAAGVPAEGALRFAVFRGEQRVGEHILRFQRQGDTLTVDVTIDIRVDLAFITVYRYTHRAREVWRGDTLIALHSQTDEDGEKNTVTARADGDELQVIGKDGRLAMPLGTFPASHWNIGLLRQRQLLDTQRGIRLAIDVADKGSETVDTRQGKVDARHFHMFGYDMENGVVATKPSYDTDLWYDAADRLVGLRFRYRGETIRYVLE